MCKSARIFVIVCLSFGVYGSYLGFEYMCLWEIYGNSMGGDLSWSMGNLWEICGNSVFVGNLWEIVEHRTVSIYGKLLSIE